MVTQSDLFKKLDKISEQLREICEEMQAMNKVIKTKLSTALQQFATKAKENDDDEN